MVLLRQCFNISMQFTPNSFHIIVAFFIAFMEVGIDEPKVDEFAYIYGIKALTHHEGFWYMTRQGTDVKGITGLRYNIGH